MTLPDPAREVDVYWAAKIDADPRWLEVLDAVERQRYVQYHRQDDRERFMVGVALTRVVAAAWLGCAPASVRIDRRCLHCGAAHGAPVVQGTDLKLSVSHAHGVVVLASAAGTAVGIDVQENLDPLTAADLSRAALAPGELVTTAEQLLVYWTRKEAVIKCTGDGLRVAPSQVSVSPPHTAPALVGYPDRPDLPGQLTMISPTGHPDGYRSALAVMHRGAVRLRERSGSCLLRSALGRPLGASLAADTTGGAPWRTGP